jgi:hypothetical protein
VSARRQRADTIIDMTTPTFHPTEDFESVADGQTFGGAYWDHTELDIVGKVNTDTNTFTLSCGDSYHTYRERTYTAAEAVELVNVLAASTTALPYDGFTRQIVLDMYDTNHMHGGCQLDNFDDLVEWLTDALQLNT